MTFHLFDDVFLLNLTLEAAKGVLKSFALLELYFSQTKNTSKLNPDFRSGWLSREVKKPYTRHRRY